MAKALLIPATSKCNKLSQLENKIFVSNLSLLLMVWDHIKQSERTYIRVQSEKI